MYLYCFFLNKQTQNYSLLNQHDHMKVITNQAMELLTQLCVIHLDGADEVRARVEVVGSRLLEPPQAEESLVRHGTAGEGTPTRDAGKAGPAFHFQVKGFECSHREFPLSST